MGAHPCEPGMNWTGDTPLTKIGPPHSLGNVRRQSGRGKAGDGRASRFRPRKTVHIGRQLLGFFPQFAQGYHLM